MQWRRLVITVEGPTEREFVKLAIAGHLAEFEIEVVAPVVVSNRKQHVRGGLTTYARLRDDLTRRLKEDSRPEVRFTTMIDLYGLPGDFPGWTGARARKSPIERVTLLERAFANDIDDPRFIPYIQLHEFEALLYCDLRELERRIDGAAPGLEKLRTEVRGLAPEEIDDGEPTAPSKRIIKHVRSYMNNKPRVGAPAAAAIPLPLLRSRCPHFDSWIGRLESFGSSPWPVWASE
jgi:hypothetical protein